MYIWRTISLSCKFPPTTKNKRKLAFIGTLCLQTIIYSLVSQEFQPRNRCLWTFMPCTVAYLPPLHRDCWQLILLQTTYRLLTVDTYFFYMETVDSWHLVNVYMEAVDSWHLLILYRDCCIVLYCIGCTYIALHHIRFLFTSQFSLVIGPVCSSTSSTPWGAHSPSCHHGTGNYIFKHTSNHCPARYPFCLGSRECTYRWSVLPKDTCSAKPREPRPIPKTFQSKVTGYSHRAMKPCSHRP